MPKKTKWKMDFYQSKIVLFKNNSPSMEWSTNIALSDVLFSMNEFVSKGGKRPSEHIEISEGLAYTIQIEAGCGKLQHPYLKHFMKDLKID